MEHKGLKASQRIYAWGNFGSGRSIVNGDSLNKDPTNIDLSIFTKVVDSDSKSHYKKAYYPAENNS